MEAMRSGRQPVICRGRRNARFPSSGGTPPKCIEQRGLAGAVGPISPVIPMRSTRVHAAERMDAIEAESSGRAPEPGCAASGHDAHGGCAVRGQSVSSAGTSDAAIAFPPPNSCRGTSPLVRNVERCQPTGRDDKRSAHS